MIKIGDRVRVRPDLTFGCYGNMQPSFAMIAHRGKEFTVKRVEKHPTNPPLVILEEIDPFGWSLEMLEPIDKER